jgi:hypothetical protein
MWDAIGLHGKISDLEYAKPYDGIPEYNTITVMPFGVVHVSRALKTTVQGTPAYMSIELQARRYLFLPLAKSEDPEAVPTDLLEALGPAEAPISSAMPDLTEPTLRPPFAYHYYHDVESAFWFFFEYLLTHIPPRDRPFSIEELQPLHNRWLAFFDVDTRGNQIRRDMILEPKQGFHMLKTLSQCGLHGREVLTLALPIGFHVSLKNAYAELEENMPLKSRLPKTSFSDKLYKEFINLIVRAQHTLAQMDESTPDVSVNVRSVLRQLQKQEQEQKQKQPSLQNQS